jgi:P4 family phage/plasmid primase-like protien
MLPKTSKLLQDLATWNPGAKAVLLQTVPDWGLGKYPLEKGWNIRNPFNSSEPTKEERDSLYKYPSLRPLNKMMLSCEHSKCNIAIITGEVSGILVIDVDNKGQGLSDFTHIVREMGYQSIDDYIQTSQTACVKTPSNGYHFYYRYREGKYKQNFGFTSGKNEIDIQGNNKCVVYPGSIYQGCKPKYEIDENKRPKQDCQGTFIVNKESHKCGASCFEECKYIGQPYIWINKPTSVDVLSVLPDVMFKYFIKDSGTPSVYEQIQSSLTLSESIIDDIIEILRERSCMGYNDWSGTILALLSVGASREQIHKWSSFAEVGYSEKRTDQIIDGYVSDNTSSSIGNIRKWCKELASDDRYNSLFINFEKNIEQALMYQDEAGLAELFYIHSKDYIRVAQLDEDKIFKFNSTTKLWEKISSSECCSLIRSVLIKIFPKALLPLKKEIHDLTKKLKTRELDQLTYDSLVLKTQKKVKELETIASSVNKTSKQQSILAQAKVKLLDKEFLDRLNMSREELAIRPYKIINLRTLQLRDRISSDYFSIESPVEYIDETKENEIQFKTAKDYLMSICVNNESLYECLTEMCGYFITRENSDRRVYVWYGDGSNGKSSLVNCLETIIGVGKYGIKTADATLVIEDKYGRKKTAGSCSPELLALKYARTALISETKDDDYLNEVILKQITGGDTIQARGLFESEDENFKINTKVFILTNNRPKFTPSKSMHKRLLLFPFNASFDETTQNKMYIENIQTNYMSYLFSIFTKAGSRIYRDKILKVPIIVEKTTKEYLSDNDVIKQFADSQFIFTSKEAIESLCKQTKKLNEFKEKDLKPIRLGDLYEFYKVYYKEETGSELKNCDKKKFNQCFTNVLPNTVDYDKNNRYYRNMFYKNEVQDLLEDEK